MIRLQRWYEDDRILKNTLKPWLIRLIILYSLQHFVLDFFGSVTKPDYSKPRGMIPHRLLHAVQLVDR